MWQKKFDLKKSNRTAQELITGTLRTIPVVMGIPIMAFCNILGDKLHRSEYTVHDYMHRKYIASELSFDELAKAIDKTVEYFASSGKYDGKEILTSSERVHILEKWTQEKRQLLSTIQLGYMILDIGKCINFAETCILPPKMRARMLITQFLNADFTQLNNSENNIILIKVLTHLQFAINYFPIIKKLAFSREKMDAYLVFSKALANIPELQPIQLTNEQS